MFHSFFSSLARSRYLSLFSFSFSFTLRSVRTAKSTIRQVLFFWLTLTRFGHLVEIRWSVCISKSQRSLCISFSRTNSKLCIYHLFIWSNLNFLHNSQWITFLTQLCLVLYSFCNNLLYSLSMWLIISSLPLHNLHLLFYSVLSSLTLTKSLWHFFMLLSEEIQFLSKGFLSMFKFCHVRFHLFVTWKVHIIVFLPIFVF